MSYAWCPNCEILTHDCSTPCGKCGGKLEYATVDPMADQPTSQSESKRVEEIKLKNPYYYETHGTYDTYEIYDGEWCRRWDGDYPEYKPVEPEMGSCLDCCATLLKQVEEEDKARAHNADLLLKEREDTFDLRAQVESLERVRDAAWLSFGHLSDALDDPGNFFDELDRHARKHPEGA